MPIGIVIALFVCLILLLRYNKSQSQIDSVFDKMSKWIDEEFKGKK